MSEENEWQWKGNLKSDLASLIGLGVPNKISSLEVRYIVLKIPSNVKQVKKINCLLKRKYYSFVKKNIDLHFYNEFINIFYRI